MKRIALIGIQGLPARYGGFETCAENLVLNSSEDVEYTVFCSAKAYPRKETSFARARLKYLPLHSHGVQSIFYDILSMILSVRGYDSLLVLGISGCIFLPVLRLITRARIVVNIDGREYLRPKWGRWAKRFLKLSERMAVRFAHEVIADSRAIQRYVKEEYDAEAHYIAYGGDHAVPDLKPHLEEQTLQLYGLEKDGYVLTVCRAEPENNLEMIVEAFKGRKEKLVIVTNAEVSDYARKLVEQIRHYDNMVVIDSVYDLHILYALRRNARIYLHGHSAGGTNPSLVEAMWFGRPILAFDVVYNRETTRGRALYFGSSDELRGLLALAAPEQGAALRQLAEHLYTWTEISKKYEALYESMCESPSHDDDNCPDTDAVLLGSGV